MKEVILRVIKKTGEPIIFYKKVNTHIKDKSKYLSYFKKKNEFGYKCFYRKTRKPKAESEKKKCIELLNKMKIINNEDYLICKHFKKKKSKKLEEKRKAQAKAFSKWYSKKENKKKTIKRVAGYNKKKSEIRNSIVDLKSLENAINKELFKIYYKDYSCIDKYIYFFNKKSTYCKNIYRVCEEEGLYELQIEIEEGSEKFIEICNPTKNPKLIYDFVSIFKKIKTQNAV